MAAIAGDQWTIEGLGEGDVHRVICGEVVSQLPRARQQVDVGMTAKIEVDEVGEGFFRSFVVHFASARGARQRLLRRRVLALAQGGPRATSD